MTLFVSNLSQQVDSPKAKNTVRNVNACVESLCEMFENILDVSKLAAGVIEPRIEDFEAERLLGRLQREFEGLANEKGIEFSHVQSSLALRSDPALLHRILSNLISNALKNTKEGRVLLGCRHRAEGAEIQIWDTGIGIPESEIENIFEEFYRGVNRRDHREGFGFGAGLGLGLSIVEHTATLLGHTVRVSSSPGKDTMFSVLVPRGRNAIAAPILLDNSDISIELKGCRILVVDDHVLALQAVKATLEDWGCQVATANSSEEAMSILSIDLAPQVLIVDYLLQNGDTGMNLIQRAEDQLGIKLSAIVLSGVSCRRLEREIENSGYRLSYKPTRPERLKNLVIECLAAEARRSMYQDRRN